MLPNLLCFFKFFFILNFRKMTSQLLEVLLLLSTDHLFELYNTNQVADALAMNSY